MQFNHFISFCFVFSHEILYFSAFVCYEPYSYFIQGVYVTIFNKFHWKSFFSLKDKNISKCKHAEGDQILSFTVRKFIFFFLIRYTFLQKYFYQTHLKTFVVEKS